MNENNMTPTEVKAMSDQLQDNLDFFVSIGDDIPCSCVIDYIKASAIFNDSLNKIRKEIEKQNGIKRTWLI